MAGSSLLIDEYLSAGDDRLLGELLTSTDGAKAGSVLLKLYDDARPFARKLLLGYVDDGCARSTHRAAVKRLFKLAEQKHDDELVAHFAVAFDRLIPRTLKTRWRYDWSTRQSYTEQELIEPKQIARRFHGELSTTKGGQVGPAASVLRSWNGFTRSTRRYLQRRALRYFRRMHKEPERFRKAAALALSLYKDEQLSTPTQLIDAWSFVHFCYHGSPVLLRQPYGIAVAPGRSLAELTPAPLNAEAWNEGSNELLQLVQEAASRPARLFAINLMEQLDAAGTLKLSKVPVSRLKPLLKSAHPEVQAFSAKLLQKSEGLSSLPIADWLELLRIDHPEALPLLCDAVAKHVHRDRLTLEQCVELSKARPAPVAELGFKWVLEKPPAGVEGVKKLLPMAKGECPSVRAKSAAFLAGRLRDEDQAPPELVRELLDSKYEDVRREALTLMEKVTRYADATELWMAMSESPYADVREQLLKSMEKRAGIYGPKTLERLWATTLLSVHKGSRAKRLAALQVAERLAALMQAPETAQQAPAERRSLLKLMSHVLRSVRGPERIAALTALSKACWSEPKLRAAVEEAVPELKLSDEVAA
ncbi:MAG: hypothetical protein QM723_23630 [Myxococcaceae bacterium]